MGAKCPPDVVRVQLGLASVLLKRRRVADNLCDILVQELKEQVVHLRVVQSWELRVWGQYAGGQSTRVVQSRFLVHASSRVMSP